MVAKAPNDIPKQVILAANMCKAIKDALKMERRYKAAIQILGDSSPVTNVFAQGCISMGITIGNIKSEQEDDTIEASAADDVKINIPERSEEAIVDTPVKPVINYNYKNCYMKSGILSWDGIPEMVSFTLITELLLKIIKSLLMLCLEAITLNMVY